MTYYLRKSMWLLAVLLVLPLNAQEVSKKEGLKAKGLRVRILAFTTRKGAEKIVIESGGSRTREITLTTHGLGSYVSVSQRELILGMMPSEEDQPVTPLAKVQLPDQGRDFLLLLIPNKSGYDCRAVRLDGSRFGSGDTLFYNAGNIPVGGVIGKKKFVVTPRRLKIINAPPVNKEPYYQVSFYTKIQEKVRIFSDTRWPHDDRSRSYVFFYVNPRTQRVTYRAVDEFVAKR
jgi:hypothetical protein